MQTRTDDTSQVGLHIFERAGLGVAPYKFLGVERRVYQACPGAPVQNGTCCAYCGTGIIYAYMLRSANGREFHVGCDCIERAGDAGLIRAYKNSPQHRAIAADKRKALDTRKSDEFHALLASHHPVFAMLRGRSHPNAPAECWGVYLERVWSYCGAAGRGRYYKLAKQLIAEYDRGERREPLNMSESDA